GGRTGDREKFCRCRSCRERRCRTGGRAGRHDYSHERYAGQRGNFALTDKRRKVLFIERKPHEFVSIERVFRQIAAALSPRYEHDFQQMPYGNSPLDTLRNLLFFRTRKADVYHITGHVHYLAMRFSPANTVLTIHDVRFLDEPSRLKRFILKKLYLDRPVKRLRYITAISENTKRAIVDATGCDKNKIRVIPV